MFDGDCYPHFDSASEAREYAKGGSWLGGTPKPHKGASPCFLAIAHCGRVLDEEGAWAMHWDTEEAAARAAKDHGWAIAGEGLICHPDCDECAAAVGAHGLWLEAGGGKPEFSVTRYAELLHAHGHPLPPELITSA